MDADAEAIVAARSHDPFAFLGQHKTGAAWDIRAFLPAAGAAFVITPDGAQPMKRLHKAGLFCLRLPNALPTPYELEWTEHGRRQRSYDPYCFGPQLSESDLHLFNEGKLFAAHRALGANLVEVDGVAGVRFATWAPNAERVSVVGDFNAWDGRRHQMRARGGSGVWELFVPGVKAGDFYKFELRNRLTGAILIKVDPYGRRFEFRPATAGVVVAPAAYEWRDETWMSARAQWDWQHRPINCYEVHLGSWRRAEDGSFLSYGELAAQLVSYCAAMCYTHVEVMPISEHPLDESWGYQTTGYFAPTSRFGSPDDFRAFVDALHAAGIGVIMDWVPGHFPRDAWALADFDGSALYEHEDPMLGQHPDWGTLIFNYGRNEVRSFLISNALYWLEEYHVDGLRVDAVASMLYLDYSRKEGKWRPNKFGGRENLEAIEFLRETNVLVHGRHPGALTFAEESTAWPMVSRPVHLGGLGFSMKWNMGWMNDTLRYIARDPVHRRYHHNDLTFGLMYSFSENFLLPLSHDEVVHGKRSLLDKMPGDAWQRFANLRLLLTYQATHPGKKLNFMGNEFGQGREWNATRALEWRLLDVDAHAGVQNTCRDLNRLYADLPALHTFDFERRGFEWIDCHDADHSIISFIRRDGDAFVIAVLNFTPVPHRDYRLGVPRLCEYREIFNSDSRHYGGSDLGNFGRLDAESVRSFERDYSIVMTVPPLAGVILAPAPESAS
ncbi:MAG TPA: 1,4-alpha-glucan branching protein GlgB [Candidatus Tumulicola sp.]|nr:1,4-alpha-glucan branching protein GlgB [Candidatus Tumulicola sp.]